MIYVQKRKKFPAVISVTFWIWLENSQGQGEKKSWKMYSINIEAMEDVKKGRQNNCDDMKLQKFWYKYHKT